MTQPQRHYDVTDDDFDFIWKNIDSPLVVRDRINVIKTRSQSYQSERDKVLDDNNKPGCFGAYGTHSCNIPACIWFSRCKQSQEDY